MRLTTLILTALATSAALAQGVPEDPGALRLERIEQGFEDVSPLATSLEQYSFELRQPSGFDSVYRVPGSDGLLMRRDGAVHALFERSQYVPTRFGAQAVAPPGTVYSIGPPSDELVASMSRGPRSLLSGASGATAYTPAPTSSLRVSNRIATTAPDSATTGIGTRSLMNAAPSVWTHEVERRRRVAALFDRLPEDSSGNADPADD